MTPLHMLTCEYPPQVGGVSDYTRQIAEALVLTGEEVHVWCPPVDAPREVSAVHIHPTLGQFQLSDLKRMSDALDSFPSPRRLLVQWVPHGYGYRSMNLPFCLWLAKRAARGDRVEVMVHEPFIEMTWQPVRHGVMAIAHRVMATILMGTANRVWVSIPAWESTLRPYALGRPVPIEWLPIPAAIETTCPIAVSSVREKYADGTQPLVGHFGSYGEDVASLLERRLPGIMESAAKPALLLVGARSEAFCKKLIAKHPTWSARVYATGYIPTGQLARYVGACDLMLQPYPDGITSRRTSAMAGLSLGRPIVTTSGHLTEPLWSESGAVMLADVSDADSFSAAAIRLMSDAHVRSRVGCLGQRLYRERFGLSLVLNTLTSRDRSLVSLPSCA